MRQTYSIERSSARASGASIGEQYSQACEFGRHTLVPVCAEWKIAVVSR